ncbi:MAG: NAD(+) diphosphatase [Clostridia bacterium]|nr:NAD(+) diphosphatase [Clostridia bacterium]
MIQDIGPSHLDNSFLPDAAAAENDHVMLIKGSAICVADAGGVFFPRRGDFGSIELTYLFSVDGERFFLCRDEDAPCPEGFSMQDLRKVRDSYDGPMVRMFAAYTAKHLADWYRDNRFCGRCGSSLRPSDKERALVCSCGYTVYPRIMPAVIVGVTDGDRLLLTRYRTGYGHNALVAGFVEIGETAEETVAREVMEETGLKVKNIRYYKSQPWGIANDLLLGYFCDLDGDGTVRMDPDELSYAEWVSRKEIELQPGHWSLTNEMMELFKNS